ncbi:hypothetical protein [uncultured Dialister sp.]|uniref:hypothetical protein n=1 Tax=uncultured Dialister sp. TaxID=278064 RepID=UPI0025E06703|nr:hypothetical protein [uncultured Dialister sp.]
MKLIAAKGGDTTTLSGEAAVKPKNPPAEGQSNFRTFFRPFEPLGPKARLISICQQPL